MATYTIINGHDAQLVNVNAGGVDVDAYSYKDGITLTSAELVIVLDGTTFGAKNVAVIADLAGDTAAANKKRSVGISSLTASV